MSREALINPEVYSGVLTTLDGNPVTTGDGEPVVIGANINRNDYLASLCGGFYTEPEIHATRIRADLGNVCADCHSYQHTHVLDLFSENKTVRERSDVMLKSSKSSMSSHALKMIREGRMPPGGFGVGSTPEQIKKNDADRRNALARYIEYISGDRSSICNVPAAEPGKQKAKGETIQ